MTEIDDTTTGEITARLGEGLDSTVFEKLDEPIGWQCRLCDGRLVLGEAVPPALDRLERAVAILCEAAAYHHRTDH